MIKKHIKFCLLTTSLIFLFTTFLYSSANRTLALEVQYPQISGQTISSSTQLPEYVRYLFIFGIFAGFFAVFISLTIAGATYALSPLSADLRSDAKDRAFGAISGLLILALTYLIVTTINPQLGLLVFSSLPPAPQMQTQTIRPAGVYFHNQAGCPPNNSTQSYTSPVADLGSLKNKINSVNISQGSDNIPYMTILYQNPNFWGKCQYLANPACQTVEPFASSASVYQYSPVAGGDGVYFYRKSYFNTQGGWLKIPNSDIVNSSSGSLYVGDLNQLTFTGNNNSGDCNVPIKEQDCIKYDGKGNCASDGRTCPNLGGENISSVKINGNYVVLFVYASPNDDPSGPWTSCQEFPTTDDANKLGPEQIKWQNIRNNKGVIPNYVIILPIQK